MQSKGESSDDTGEDFAERQIDERFEKMSQMRDPHLFQLYKLALGTVPDRNFSIKSL